MERREFLWILGGGVVAFEIGCHDTKHGLPGTPADAAHGADTTDEPPDAAAEGCQQTYVKMHDTYAQALYLDGSLGPLTGTIEVAYVLAGTTITLDFWHGHNGVLHRYTLQPADFDALKRGERITLPTTVVEDHSHTLFIDPKDETYRVPGAPDVDVPVGPCM
jgi:hypothetical protein